MERMMDWKTLAAGYGRDYGWLEKAARMYPCRVAQDGQRAAVSFFAGEVPGDTIKENVRSVSSDDDFGIPYGMPPGLTYCFLLESTPQQTASAWEAVGAGKSAAAQAAERLWAPLLPERENGDTASGTVYCIPVKSGCPALGWQLGFSLLAIRPLALLRPFYLFAAAKADPAGMSRSVPLADAKRLGRLLEDGWLGVGCDGTGTQVLLRRAADGDRLL